jgi:hypothetical protein
MAKKENTTTWKELNEIELESGRFTKPLHMSILDDLDLVHSINSPIEFLHEGIIL